MKITIFYSWQSTTETKYNRSFISECIKGAIKNIKTIPEYNSVEFVLQDAIRGESGQVPVADTIINKRIPNCDIFIADLSVTNSDTIDLLGDKYKPFQNNNVILEYGVAINAIKLERIIGVLNNQFGSPNKNPDNIPFDIRHLRFPIEYRFSDENETEKTEIKKQLISDLTSAFKDTVPFVLQFQKNRHKPLITWAEWTDNFKNPDSEDFIYNDKIHEVKDTIIKSINLSVNTNPIRVLGLSGLGKTRILHEIFRPQPDDNESILLSNRVLYLNCNDYQNQINFPEIIANIKNEKSDAILIIDNCDLITHKIIVRNINGLSLITIDSNPEESDSLYDTNYIKIGKNDLADVVEKIVDNNFGTLEKDKIETIKLFSQGIPLMAVLLGQSIRNGEQFIGKLNDKDLLSKLLGEKANQTDWRSILKSCSLFDYFGYQSEVSIQYEFIATNENITVSNSNQQVRLSTFLDVVKYYLNREIFEKRGRYVSMRPFPLAMALAQEWLESCTPQRLLDVITDIAKLEEPHRTTLTNSLSEQMKYLGYNDNAKTIVEKLIGYGSPFDNAEVLNTELGSRLFRSFVEVNPVAVSKNFNRQFSIKSTEELLLIEAGRRNIIWSLEKLCFDKRTFIESTKILYAFAVAENETWGNNATGQFLQLFHILLSGTEANLQDKWKIIEWGLEHKDERFVFLALKAMKSGLNATHFHRTGGAEKQGTKQLQDNNPTWNEISEYWENIILKLSNIITENNQFFETASDILANSIREIVHAGFLKILIPKIEKVIEYRNYDWDKGLESLKMTLHYERKSISQQDAEVIQNLISKLTKTDFISRFFASTHYEDDDVRWSSEKFMQREKNRMSELAVEFIESNLSWDDTLPSLYIRDEKNLIHKSEFGVKVYELIKYDPDKVNLFIDKSLEILSGLDPKTIDYSILAGFIEKSSTETKNILYVSLFNLLSICHLLFYFISFDEKGFEHVDKLFNLVDNNKSDISNFSSFKYRAVLQKISTDELSSFKEKLFSYGDDGYALVIDLFSSIRNKENNLFLKNVIKECVLKLGINYHKIKYIHDYEYAKNVKEILQDVGETDFAISLIKSLIDAIDWENTFHLDHYIQEICAVLVKVHFSSIWPDLSSALIAEDEDFVKYWGLKYIFGSHIGGVGRNTGVLFEGDIEMIFDWCSKNKPIAAIRLAALVPIYDDDNQNYSKLNPITQRLIDLFGDDEKVLNELSCNMGSFSWTGSIVPLYQAQKELFESISFHSIPQVAEWANKNIQYAEIQIENEMNRDAESFL